MTIIKGSRIADLLHWHDDMAGDQTTLFVEMTNHRDTAALIRQLQAEVQDAWHAGLDAGREQGRGKDHVHQLPSAPVGVERKYPDDGNGDDDAYNRGWNDCLDALAQQPAARTHVGFVKWFNSCGVQDRPPSQLARAAWDAALSSQQPAAVDGAIAKGAAKELLAARSHIGPRRPSDEDDAERWDRLTELAEALAQQGTTTHA